MTESLEDLARKLRGNAEFLLEPKKESGEILGKEFNQVWVEAQMKRYGLVWCCTCGRFIDEENHNIDHVFARTYQELIEKSVIERLKGNLKDWRLLD